MPVVQRKSVATVTWRTQQMVLKSHSRDVVMRVALREILFYSIFVVIVTIMAVTMTFPSMYYLTRVVQDMFVNRQFTTVGDFDMKFNEIRTAADFWAYSTTILFDGFYWEYWYDSKKPVSASPINESKILYENKLLGVPRLRQLKVRNNSCVIQGYFTSMFEECFAEYSTSYEDTEPFGLKQGSAWRHSPASKTQSLSYEGKFGTYSGGGYYIDLFLQRNRTYDAIMELKKNLWITRGTRCIFLDFTVYNANLNLFCVAKIVFEFPATGGVVTSSSFQTLKFIRYVSAMDYFSMSCELIFVGFIVFYTFEEIIEAKYFRRTYLQQFWTYIDLLLLLFAYSVIVVSIIRKAVVDESIEENLKVIQEYGNFEYAAKIQVIQNCLIAIIIFFVYLKIFKFLTVNKTMGQLNTTLRRCAVDILGFLIMFLVIFLAYALLGNILFGTEVERFCGVGNSMFTLLRAILGDFDYMEIKDVHQIFAPLYFLSYICLVFFVLLNMFLAIINDTYSDVKTEIAVMPDKLQLTGLLKRGFWRLLNKLGCVERSRQPREDTDKFTTTVKEIRGALKRCGFTDLEIEIFFQRYNLDPSTELGEFDINKLMEDLEAKPYDISRTPTQRKSAAASGQAVTVDDFVSQQGKLAAIEKTISGLTVKIDVLLKKLDTLENIRKVKK